MTADYPQPKIMREMKEMVKELSVLYRVGNTEQAAQYIADAERLIMSDEHKLTKVYRAVIEDPAFRTALVTVIATIVPEQFTQMQEDQIIMLLTFMSALSIAATED